MVKVDLKGLHTVKAKGRVYVYAWRGGPAVSGKPGTPEFLSSYNEAVAGRTVVAGDRARAAVAAYRASDAYKALAESTRKQWSRWLDKIADHFGDLRMAQFNRPEKIRPVIRKWRNGFAANPRSADYGMQVLSRVCAHMVDPMGEIAANPCEGIKRLYSSDRSEIIWTDEDIAAVKAVASTELGWAFDLAAHTGLRLGDLCRLSWSHIGPNAIELPTNKSRRKGKRQRTAVIPLYADLRAILDRIPKRATTVLTNTRGRPWTVDGIGTSIYDAKVEAKMQDEMDLHFHDLRGTAATKFYLGDLSIRVISEILAWDEETVERIIRHYVGRQAAVMETIRMMDEAKKRT